MQWNRTTAGGGLGGALLIALVIIAYNWSATPRLDGRITDVRTLGMDAASSVAIVNFEATNTSNRDLAINYREVEVLDRAGHRRQGRILSVFDIERLFQYYPALGGMKDEPLLDERYIAPGETFRGLTAARFEVPKHELDLRQELIFRTVDTKSRKTEIRLSAE